MWIAKWEMDCLKKRMTDMERRITRLEHICLRESNQRLIDFKDRDGVQDSLSVETRMKKLESVFLREAEGRVADLSNWNVGRDNILRIENIADKTFNLNM